MALTQVPIELSSTPGIVDNSNATAITIDSSENVGIGTGSPSEPLTVLSAQDYQITAAYNAANSTSYGYYGIKNNNTGNPFYFNVGGAERMRIDASGNLLVGKTSSSFSVAGIGLMANDQIFATATSDNALALNRLSTDGDICKFYKDSSTVGSIGSRSGTAIYIDSAGTGTAGLDIDGAIAPRINGSLDSGGNVDLGASAYRFRDLYLSGGVYLGGTGSANLLDDYEEGTWTPTLNSGSFSSVTATYTKVGSLVQLTLDAIVGTGGGSNVAIPFTCANTTGMAVYTSNQDFAAGRTQFNGVMASSLLFFRVTGDNIVYAAQTLTAGATIHASFTYRTSA
jgi:hypothetical protein